MLIVERQNHGIRISKRLQWSRGHHALQFFKLYRTHRRHSSSCLFMYWVWLYSISQTTYKDGMYPIPQDHGHAFLLSLELAPPVTPLLGPASTHREKVLKKDNGKAGSHQRCVSWSGPYFFSFCRWNWTPPPPPNISTSCRTQRLKTRRPTREVAIITVFRRLWRKKGGGVSSLLFLFQK